MQFISFVADCDEERGIKVCAAAAASCAVHSTHEGCTKFDRQSQFTRRMTPTFVYDLHHGSLSWAHCHDVCSCIDNDAKTSATTGETQVRQSAMIGQKRISPCTCTPTSLALVPQARRPLKPTRWSEPPKVRAVRRSVFCWTVMVGTFRQSAPEFATARKLKLKTGGSYSSR